MEELNKYIVWVGPYIRDELTDEQKQKFEDYLVHSEELREELRLQSELQDTINNKDEYDRFKSALEEAQKSFFGKHKKKIAKILLLSWWLAA